MKAGAFTPATPRTAWSGRRAILALNEGGGFHPRNPGHEGDSCHQIGPRSMKAGAFTPATPPRPHSSRVDPWARSMKAGAFTPATLRNLHAGGGYIANAQ